MLKKKQDTFVSFVERTLWNTEKLQKTIEKLKTEFSQVSYLQFFDKDSGNKWCFVVEERTYPKNELLYYIRIPWDSNNEIEVCCWCLR